jgi:hypothetical protein
MGNIDWLPITDLPEEMKDGRQVLLGFRYEYGTINGGPPHYLYEAGRYYAGRWIDIGDQSRAIGKGEPDVWAEISRPGAIDRGIPVYASRDATDDVLGKGGRDGG